MGQIRRDAQCDQMSMLGRHFGAAQSNLKMLHIGNHMIGRQNGEHCVWITFGQVNTGQTNGWRGIAPKRFGNNLIGRNLRKLAQRPMPHIERR